MAITLFVCCLVAAVAAAPSVINGFDRDWQKEFVTSLEFNKLQDLHRAKRSSYGNMYMSPCAAAAASAPIPAYAPAMSSAALYSSAGQTAGPYSYSQAYQTVPSHKVASSYYSYGRPSYRSEEDLENDQEIMDFSDMNHAAAAHMPMARMNSYSYEAAPIAQVVATAGSQGQATGQMVGLFPNANVGGCSVPLLVSCSPSIAQGQIVKARPYYGSGSSNQGSLYRVVDEHHHHEEAGEHETGTSSEHTPHDASPTGHKHQ
ncbi:uncharacterized protein [Epargyreus clarus]|uniref:uncharacterized protein n=1 Tax=Epargyreus clarus TaxID=520877 RepID=UPI003C2DC630